MAMTGPPDACRLASLWLADREMSPSSPPSPESTDLASPADVVVIGAGITGLTTAVLLARAGKNVTVVEARHVGAGATGNTTGKLSVLQGSKLARIAARHSADVLRDYVRGNAEGRDWLVRHCENHGIPWQSEADHAYAQTSSGLAIARDTFSACQEAGLTEAEWIESADVPFPFHGGVRLPDQAQLDPVPLLNSLALELESHGGTLLQGVRAVSVADDGLLRVTLRATHPTVDAAGSHMSVTGHRCILATGTPILDRGGFFARLTAKRSYCMAFDSPHEATGGMFISVDSPTRSVRYAPSAGGEKLIVGGAGHPVGRGEAPAGGVAELAEWAELHYPGATPTHFWSAQDYSPIDELPYVGTLLPGYERIRVATGFDKWGLTNGVAAALILSAQVLGGHIEWARAFASWNPHELRAVTAALRANLEVGLNLVKGWVAPVTASPDGLSEGAGVVSGLPWQLRADSLVDGEHRTVSAICPHLGGVVRWNDADRAWECPLHGSRFAADGRLLEGPATRGLSEMARPQ